jgi:hypothetical protein
MAARDNADVADHDVHSRVLEAAARGEAAIFAVIPEANQLPAYGDEEFWEGGTIDGLWLSSVLQSPDYEFHSFGVVIEGARITHGLDLAHADVRHRLALSACQLGEGDIALDYACARSLELTGVALAHFSAVATTIMGDVSVHSSTVGRCIDFRRATISGALNLIDAHIADDAGQSLRADSAHFGRGVYLLAGSTAQGKLSFNDALVENILDLSGTQIENPRGTALGLGGTTIEGSLILDKGFRAKGQVRLLDSRVRGSVYCGASDLSADGRPVMVLSRTHIGGDLYLDGATAKGQVSLQGARIDGNAVLTGAHLDGKGASSLIIDGCQIGGRMRLDGGLRSTGTIEILGTSVAGRLDLSGAQLANATGDAITSENCTFDASVFMAGGFAAEGRVALVNASVTGDVDLRGSRLMNETGVALDLTNTTVTGTLHLADAFAARHTVVLRGASTSTLHDDQPSWPQRLDLDGFNYVRLSCPPADRGWRARRQWLRRQLEPSVYGYSRLAQLYRTTGEDANARRILIEYHNSTLHPPQHWKVLLPSGWRGTIARLWRWVLRVTIGHGFAPERALLVALPLLLVMSLWVSYGAQHDMFIPREHASASSSGVTVRSSSCTRHYPCIQPIVFALDLTVPIIDLGQRSEWAVDQGHRGKSPVGDGRWLASAMWLTNIVGWVLATLVAASFTNVVRRD